MTRWFPDGMPPPMANDEAVPWWRAAAEHRLVVQRCGECSHLRLPPAPVCPQCRSAEADWQEISGKGKLYTFTVVHRPVAADQALPFVIAVIELEGAQGLRMISNIVDTPPEELEIGMALEVVWEDMSPDLAVPRFRGARVG